MIIKEEQKEKIKDIPNIEEIVKKGNIEDLLSEISDEIFMNGMDENYNLNDRGKELQRIYDELLKQN